MRGARGGRGATSTPRSVRPPAVAGLFYPDDPAELRRVVEHALAAAPAAPAAPAAAAPAPPKAVIAPHAGYVYSGVVAASAYARLALARGSIERILLLGPAHRVPLRGIALSSATAFATPLGEMRVDTAAEASVLTASDVVVDDRAHADEHSLEVHLPFLQVALGDVAIVPMVVGEARAETVAAVLELLWGGPETAIIVSSDLSHYHDHATATELDRRTAEVILERRPDDLALGRACGVYPLRGLLLAARNHGLAVELLDLRNSGDTAGPRDRVVGYGSFAVA